MLSMTRSRPDPSSTIGSQDSKLSFAELRSQAELGTEEIKKLTLSQFF
jgi:hypothetical protein